MGVITVLLPLTDRLYDTIVSRFFILHPASFAAGIQSVRQELVDLCVCEKLYGEKYIYIVYILYASFINLLNSFF